MNNSDRSSDAGLASRRELLCALAGLCLTAPLAQAATWTLQQASPPFEERECRRRWLELYAGTPEQHLRNALQSGLAEAPGLVRQAEIARGEYGEHAGALVTKSELALLVLLEDEGPGAFPPPR